MRIGFSKITPNWMVAIPKKVREKLGCRPDDLIFFYNDKDKIFIKGIKEENIKED